MRFERIQDRAIGRWRAILPGLGVNERFLSSKHGPCPICGGLDRFRWDDKAGSGSFFCNQCGAGSGVDLVMKVRGVPFIEAKKLIEEKLPSAPFVAPKARQQGAFNALANVWQRANPLNGRDAASLYLERRGLKFDKAPASIRWLSSLPYIYDDKTRSEHPAMVALFVSPDRTEYTVQYTYLDDDGHKAGVPKPRKQAPAKVPPGGAVRLAPSAETMGIAEGVETALSAAKLFDVPVWAALNAGNLTKWEPPTTCRHVIVFGDNDGNATGQAAAWALAHRLIVLGFTAEVRIPGEVGDDWNDVLHSETRQ
jgi:putative DNA primase/helicase